MAKESKRGPSVAESEKASYQKKLEAREKRDAGRPKSKNKDVRVRGAAHQGHGKHGADKQSRGAKPAKKSSKK